MDIKNNTLLNKLKSCFMNKNELSEYKSKMLDNTYDLQENIYNVKNSEQAYKTHSFVHYFFKYKLLLPLIYIIEKICGKYLKPKLKNELYNKNIFLFDKSYNEAVDDWINLFLKSVYGRNKTKEEFYKTQYSDESTRLLFLMKDILIMVCHNDTAYREFLNMLMYRIGINMSEEYKGKKIHHLMYTSKDVFDVSYFRSFDLLMKNSPDLKNK